jgi:hypothetical protein
MKEVFMRRFTLRTAAALGMYAATSSHALPAVLYSSVPSLNTAPTAANAASYGPIGSNAPEVYEPFKLDSSSMVTQIDFVVSGHVYLDFPITVAIVPLLSGNLPNTQNILYRQQFSNTEYSYKVISTGAFAADLVTVVLAGIQLAAGSYDITFYGSNLSVAEYPLSGESDQLRYTVYQAHPSGFITNRSLGFDLIGNTIAIPEPTSAGLLGTGLIALMAIYRKRNSGVVGSRSKSDRVPSRADALGCRT